MCTQLVQCRFMYSLRVLRASIVLLPYSVAVLCCSILWLYYVFIIVYYVLTMFVLYYVLTMYHTMSLLCRTMSLNAYLLYKRILRLIHVKYTICLWFAEAVVNILVFCLQKKKIYYSINTTDGLLRTCSRNREQFE